MAGAGFLRNRRRCVLGLCQCRAPDRLCLAWPRLGLPVLSKPPRRPTLCARSPPSPGGWGAAMPSAMISPTLRPTALGAGRHTGGPSPQVGRHAFAHSRGHPGCVQLWRRAMAADAAALVRRCRALPDAHFAAALHLRLAIPCPQAWLGALPLQRCDPRPEPTFDQIGPMFAKVDPILARH